MSEKDGPEGCRELFLSGECPAIAELAKPNSVGWFLSYSVQ
jgi:hypothetical protein